MIDKQDGSNLADHLIALPGSSWALWRYAGLRGAGFPASEELRLASPRWSVACDRILEAEDNARRARNHTLALLDDALGRLESGQASVDEGAEKALLKAKRALKAGKLPNPLPDLQEAGDAAGSLRIACERAEIALQDFRQVFNSEVVKASQAIHQVASKERFQEAVIWQNRRAYHTALRPLLVGPPASGLRGSKQRRHEELVASYLQRYCVKNDTIGFFGPVGWARITSEASAITADPGPSLVAAQSVYFEAWGMDVLAEVIGGNEAIQEWIPPRLMPTLYFEGKSVHLPGKGSIELSAKQLAAIRSCDGRRTARQIAIDLTLAYPHFPNEQEVYRTLRALQNMGIISWTFTLPIVAHPEAALRRLLEGIGDEDLRRRMLDPLTELEN